MACRQAVVPQAETHIQLGLSRLTGAALALATLASFGILLSRTLEMNGGAWNTLWSDMRTALLATHFGHVWRWRIPALAVAWLAWIWTRRHPRQTWTGWLIALALAAIAMTRSETGHPADQGDFTLAVWIDWAHLIAAGAWVGSLFGMSLVVFPNLRVNGDPLPASATVFRRLSAWCGGALALLLGAGIYNAIHEIGGIEDLWTSRYGITLDVKLAIVLAMIAIGAHNRYIKLPRLLGAAKLAGAFPTTSQRRTGASKTPNPESRIVRICARAVLLESVLGFAVIGATAVLLHAMPPADARGMRATEMPMSTASVPLVHLSRTYPRGSIVGLVTATRACPDVFFSSVTMGIQ